MAEASTLSELRDLLNRHLDGQGEPKNLREAGRQARDTIREARKKDAEKSAKDDAEDAKDGAKDEATEAS